MQWCEGEACKLTDMLVLHVFTCNKMQSNLSSNTALWVQSLHAMAVPVEAQVAKATMRAA